ncbi:hypothetical protein [Novosphingobium sp. B-7]|uniref:hypothetical protein n=1 Tax=Novosphingobium sp. B-7 TaxID=1298855 RepID=UPI0003B62EEC|nr:hypothetical protein [Novosphingobium sp. B-7]
MGRKPGKIGTSAQFIEKIAFLQCKKSACRLLRVCHAMVPFRHLRTGKIDTTGVTARSFAAGRACASAQRN